MKYQIHRRPHGLLLLTTLATLLTQSAKADIISQWIDSKNWSFQVTEMPDFDQRRAADPANGILGLPSNGGMYCVPTSTMNALAYIANHGYPTMQPLVHDWQGWPQPDLYNLASAEIFILGAQMFTDPAKGTDGQNAFIATQLWLDFYAPGNFAVTHDWAHGGHCPLFKKIAKKAAGGSLVLLSLGHYPGLSNDSDKLLRDNGHCTTLVGGLRTDYGLYELGMNDPASDEGPGDPNRLFLQSPFIADVWKLQDYYAAWGYKDANGDTHYHTRTQTRFLDQWERAIDGYLAITPKYGLTARDQSIKIHIPGAIFGLERAVTKTVELGSRVLDIALDPTSTEHPYILDGVNAVMLLDTITGESTRFADVTNPRHLTIGGKELYTFVVSPDQLYRFHEDGSKRSVPLRSPLDAIAFDESRNRLLGVSLGESKLRVFDAALNLIGNFALPAIDGDGTVDMGYCDGDGCTYIHGGGSRKVTRVAFSEGGRPMFVTINLNCTGNIGGFFVDEKGNFFLACDGVVRAFTSRGTLWENAPLTGMPAGNKLQILKPFTNYDPTYINSPSYYNINMN